jgi:hypothetical protein
MSSEEGKSLQEWISAAEMTQYALPGASEKLMKSMVRDNTKVLTISQIEAIEDDSDHDYFVVAVLYKIVHYKHDVSENMDRFAKKPRREYNRMLFFGIPYGRGETFTVVLHSNEESVNTFQYCREDTIVVGRPFALFEPSVKPRVVLQEDQKVIELSVPLLPFGLHLCETFSDMTENVYAGTDRFFVRKNQQVHVKRVMVRGRNDIMRACCSGHMCDRQHLYGPNQECGCLSVNRKISGLVMELYVTAQLPLCSPIPKDQGNKVNKEDRKGRTTVAFRSLRTTKLFMKNFKEMPLKDIFVLRKAVDKCVEYINRQTKEEGFTVMGVVTRGKTKGDEGHATANDPTYHLVYLFPSNVEVAWREEYLSLQYTDE